MKLKILICVVLIVSIFCSVCGCTESFSQYIESLDTYKKDGVTYERHYNNDEKFYTVIFVTGLDGNRDVIYIPDEIDDGRVIGVRSTWIRVVAVERIYFPWSIQISPVGNIYYTKDEKTTTKYIISASTATLIDTNWSKTFAIPKILYDEYVKTENDPEKNIIPANISYMFNYDGAPNEKYYFVDLIEESGKLTKPPYDPKRTGYDFKGWYKESECINEWNFDTDIVTIEYDENGERIYEEICLYAKWMRKFY